MPSVDGCDSVVATTLTVNTTYDTTATAVICQGDSIQLPGGAYVGTSGTYYDTLPSVDGCDSVIATTLSVSPNYSINTPNDTICDGDSTLIFGTYRKTAGTYYDTLSSVNACDSVTATTLIVKPTYFINTSDETICEGDSVAIFGVFQTIAGIYYDSLSTINGCDSISTTVLTVNPLPTVNVGADTMICNGCSITLNAGSGFTSYDWSTGENTQTIDVDSAGTYTVQVTDANGCVWGDTIVVGIVSGTNQSTISNHQYIIVYPNPNTGQFTLEIDLQEETRLSIKLYHFTGQLIYSEDIDNVTGNYTQQIDFSGQALGIYYLQIMTKEGVIIRKVVYQ